MDRRIRFGTTFAAGAAAGLALGGVLSSPVGPGAEDLALADGPPVDPPGTDAFRRRFELVTGSPWREGNNVQVLHNGDEIFPAMLAAIRGARTSVNLATYIYWAGDIGRELAEACEERAREGVTVRVLLDSVGARPMDEDLVERLTQAGCDVEWVRPIRLGRPGNNHRTHRKLLVVDGCVGFTGGVGIADEWTGDAQDPDHWRDTHLRITGPVVRDLQGAFQEHWLEVRRELLPLDDVPELEPAGTIRASCLRSAPSLAPTVARVALQMAIASARSRVDVTTAYFAPGPGLVADLVAAAAERDVDVRVLVPGPYMDKRVVREAGRNSYDALLRAGVRVFEYQRTMLHAKVLTVDGEWATCGSMNMDSRSFALNDECNLAIADAGVAHALHERFDQDLEHAREITAPGRRSLRSRAEGLATSLARRQL